MPTIRQDTLTDIDVDRASSGNIVLVQDSINCEASAVSVEIEALPALIAALVAFTVERTDNTRAALVEEFCEWWHNNREGSVNDAYRRIDAFVKAVERTQEPR
jgi:hypothetical protein